MPHPQHIFVSQIIIFFLDIMLILHFNVESFPLCLLWYDMSMLLLLILGRTCFISIFRKLLLYFFLSTDTLREARKENFWVKLYIVNICLGDTKKDIELGHQSRYKREFHLNVFKQKNDMKKIDNIQILGILWFFHIFVSYSVMLKCGFNDDT